LVELVGLENGSWCRVHGERGKNQSKKTGENTFELLDVSQAMLQGFKNDRSVDVDVLMNQGVSKADHANPIFSSVCAGFQAGPLRTLRL
jgi:hypothetical protein